MIPQLRNYLGYHQESLERFCEIWLERGMDRYAGAEFSPDTEGQQELFVRWPEQDAYLRIDLVSQTMFGEFVDFPSRSTVHTEDLPIKEKHSWNLITTLLKTTNQPIEILDQPATEDHTTAEEADAIKERIRSDAARLAKTEGPGPARLFLEKTAEQTAIDGLRWEPSAERPGAVCVRYNAGYGLRFRIDVEPDQEKGTYCWTLVHEATDIESAVGFESQEQAKTKALDALKTMIQPEA